VPIGIVTHGQGLVWTKITLSGQESHAGSTPMDRRVNAGLGMARIIASVDDIAQDYAPNARATVGQCDVYPNAVNVIPGQAILTIDMRNPDQDQLDGMVKDLYDQANKIAEDIGLEIEFEELSNMSPIAFDTDAINHLREASKTLGYQTKDLVSGAGHDAFWISKIAPSAMIMCPCVGGLSHNEAEDITPEWATASTDVLYHAVLNMAEISTHE